MDMTSAEKVKLVVEDCQGSRTMNEVVPDEEINGIVDGAQIFNIMNSHCGFALWEWPVLETRGRQRYTVYSGFSRELGVQKSIQRIVDRDRSTPSTGPCVFTLEVRKKHERPGNGPRDPESAPHPGIRPVHGPDYGGFETPVGPEKSLDRMRGILGCGSLDSGARSFKRRS